MNATNQETLDLISFSDTASQHNPLFSEHQSQTMLNVGSVLRVLRDFINSDENPGIREGEHIGATLLLQTCIKAIDAQAHFDTLKSRVKGGAA